MIIHAEFMVVVYIFKLLFCLINELVYKLYGMHCQMKLETTLGDLASWMDYKWDRLEYG